MDRQTLRDGVYRFNADGTAGLADWQRSGRRSRLCEGEQAVLKALILRGPYPEPDGISVRRVVGVRRICRDRLRGGLHGSRHAPTDERARPIAPEDPAPPSAIRPDDAFGLVLPHADTALTSLFLDAFSASLAPSVTPFSSGIGRAGTSPGG